VKSSSSIASRLQPRHRQELAVKILSKHQPINHIAEKEKVSRKFLHRQKNIAHQALNKAFDKPEKDDQVLYYLPVTQQWINQLILALILICHCSYRGVVELCRDLFDYPISVGTIHNRVQEAVPQVRKINQSQDLSSIEVALLDELFQGNRPVLTGIDAHSTYCFL
jgi:hypothetical protein